MPSGARRGWTADRDQPGYAYARLDMADEVRMAIAELAWDLLGSPYGFAQYGAITGLTLEGGEAASPTAPLARYVQRRDPRTGRPLRRSARSWSTRPTGSLACSCSTMAARPRT